MEEGRAAGSHAQQPTMDSIGWVVGQDPREESSERSKWDIFLSYRVDADAELVKELYWRLRGTDVTVNGKTHRLRVFWDHECLKPGERWEDGFAKAICSTAVVVVVMSRHAYKMGGQKARCRGAYRRVDVR